MVFLTSSVRSASRALIASRNALAAVISGGVVVLAGAASAGGVKTLVEAGILSLVIVGFFSVAVFIVFLLFVCQKDKIIVSSSAEIVHILFLYCNNLRARLLSLCLGLSGFLQVARHLRC